MNYSLAEHQIAERIAALPLFQAQSCGYRTTDHLKALVVTHRLELNPPITPADITDGVRLAMNDILASRWNNPPLQDGEELIRRGFFHRDLNDRIGN